MAFLYNQAQVITATTGTNPTITLGAVVQGYVTFSLAGATNGQTVSYGIRDGANSEAGAGVYFSSGPTLVRNPVISTNSNNRITLSGSAAVFTTALKEDIANLREDNSFTGTQLIGQPDVNGENLQISSYTGLYNWTTPDTTDAAAINFYRSSSGTVGVGNIIVAGSRLGEFDFFGYDGANYIPAAAIQVYSDGTPATNDMAGAISVRTTPAGGSSPVEHLRILANGTLFVCDGDQGAYGPSGYTPRMLLSNDTDFPVFLLDNFGNAAGGIFVLDDTNIFASGDIVLKTGNNFDSSPDATGSEILRANNATKEVIYSDATSVASYFSRTACMTGSAHTVSSTTGTVVTDLKVSSLQAGTYRFIYFLICRTSTAGDGIKFGINYTGTTTKIVSRMSWSDTGTTQTNGVVDDVATGTTGQIVAHSTNKATSTTAPNMNSGTGGFANANSDCLITIEGVIVVSDNADLELWHASESTNPTTVEVGSNVHVTRMG